MRRRGYTLIELLITVGIMGLLSGMLIVYSTTGRAQVALFVEESKIAQILLRAKSVALATYVDPVGPCGYGLRVDSAARTYSLFSYKESDCANITSIDPSDSAKYRVVETYTLPPSLAFQDGANKLDAVLFVPPDPRTFISSGGSILSGGAGNIYLATVDGTASIRVSVTTAGQITF
jgi:prepilin-type N-terminal cleavage/methylation domain-containing protein